MKKNNVEDKILELMTKEDSHLAIDLIYKTYYNTFLSIAQKMLNNSDDAEDVTQEIFCNIGKSLSSFKGKSSLYTWFYRIALNTIYSFCNKGKKEKSKLFFDLEERPLTDETHPDGQCEKEYIRNLINQSIDMLEEGHKLVFLLHELDGMKLSEMSKMLDLTESAIKSRLFRARKKLKSILETGFPVEGKEAMGILHLDSQGYLN